MATELTTPKESEIDDEVDVVSASESKGEFNGRKVREKNSGSSVARAPTRMGTVTLLMDAAGSGASPERGRSLSTDEDRLVRPEVSGTRHLASADDGGLPYCTEFRRAFARTPRKCGNG
jgi:hypothetical protein